MFSMTGWGPRACQFCSRRIVLLAAVLVPSFLAGCGTLKNGRGWGQDAVWPVDLEQIARAGCDAFFSPATLVPLAGAAIFAIDDLDDRVSDWASERNPIFGSQNGAEDASNHLKEVLYLEAIGTAWATPSGDTPGVWALSKLRGGAVELGAVAVTGGLTGWLKDVTDRQRPDRSDERSFPSGHTSQAFSYTTLANRNLRSIDFLEDAGPLLQIGNTVLGSGVAWARVEARRHHPSDVLVGAALGHFVTAFIHDAFMNLSRDGRVDVAVFSTGDGAGLSLCFRF